MSRGEIREVIAAFLVRASEADAIGEPRSALGIRAAGRAAGLREAAGILEGALVAAELARLDDAGDG